MIDVNGERDKNAIERIGLHTISMQDPELAIKAMVDAVIKCLSDDRASRGNNSRESCESGCFEGMAQCSAKTKFERCDSTSKIDLGKSSVILISAYGGL